MSPSASRRRRLLITDASPLQLDSAENDEEIPAAPPLRVGDPAVIARVLARAAAPLPAEISKRRDLLVEWCRLLGDKLDADEGKPSRRRTAPITAPVEQETGLSRRMRQTLGCLLSGDAEKQIARRLEVSQHTVHVYVKALYRHYEVNSRGELLAQFLQRASPEQATGLIVAD